MVTKEEFNKVWKDSTKEDILNQFYYEHIAIRKAIEYFKYQLENLDFYEDTKAKMLCAMGITLLQNGSDKE